MSLGSRTTVLETLTPSCLVASHTLQVAHGDFFFGLVVVLFYGPANMTHKLSSACAEMITSYHISPQQICFTLKLEAAPSRFCGLVAVFVCVFFVCCLCLFCVFVLLWFFVFRFCFSVFNPGTWQASGLCIGPLPVYFCGHYSIGPCVIQ